MSDTPYNERFFRYHDAGARTSAAAVVPLVLDYARPKSVVDVGCGIGTWLAAFKAAGVGDYLGIDGDYVDRRLLAIEPERFLAHDLTEPIDVARRFDLAVCLEVAEHLSESKADTLVDSLVRLAPLVLFSAAIPYQQGEGHVNEQWPEYWSERFAARGYIVVDALRDALWLNDDVEPWYRQNLLFFVDRARLADYPRLQERFKVAGETPYLARVHPEHLKKLFANADMKIRAANVRTMQARLQLREFNLLAFPDWQLPPAVLLDELRGLLAALVAHPQRERFAILISIGRDEGSLVTQLVHQAHAEVFMPGGQMLAAPPGVNVVGGPRFTPLEWEMLLDCAGGRLVLAHEDAATVAALDADKLPKMTLEVFRREHPDSLRAFV